MNDMNDAIDMLVQLFKILVDDVTKAVDAIASLCKMASSSEVDLPFWKPYRCRMCGCRYATSTDARMCIERHQGWIKKAYKHDRKTMPSKCAGKRIAPRNREARMRSTEIRRFKSAS